MLTIEEGQTVSLAFDGTVQPVNEGGIADPAAWCLYYFPGGVITNHGEIAAQLAARGWSVAFNTSDDTSMNVSAPTLAVFRAAIAEAGGDPLSVDYGTYMAWLGAPLITDAAPNPWHDNGGANALFNFAAAGGGGGGTPCTCTASLDWAPPQGDVTAVLTATPNTLTVGEVTTLTYGTTGAHSAAIDSGVGPVPPPSGSVPAAPTANLTYTLDALGDWLTHASATADVTVSAPGIDPGDPAPLDCRCDWRPAAAPACSGWITGDG